jgi:hypothetical protein
MGRFEQLWERTQKEIPGARIVLHKDSWFLKLTRWLMKNVLRLETDYSHFTTTVSRTMYVPDDFWEWSDNARYKLLRHELMHLRQFRNWPFGFLGKPAIWWVNFVCMAFAYILCLPVLLTIRAKFERAGYEQSMLARYELGGLRSDSDKEWYARRMEKTFGSGIYFWMWLKKAAYEWAIATIKDIEAGKITNDRDRIE